MRKRIGHRRLATALGVAVMLLAPALAVAGSRRLPPEVDLDPDRGMSFGRMPKTSFDRRVFDPLKKSLGSRVMDPDIDPYNSVVRPSRYEPGTGKITDSLTDKLREMRRNEETSRKNRNETERQTKATQAKAATAASIVKQRTQRGVQSPVRPLTPKDNDD